MLTCILVAGFYWLVPANGHEGSIIRVDTIQTINSVGWINDFETILIIDEETVSSDEIVKALQDCEG